MKSLIPSLVRAIGPLTPPGFHRLRPSREPVGPRCGNDRCQDVRQVDVQPGDRRPVLGKRDSHPSPLVIAGQYDERRPVATPSQIQRPAKTVRGVDLVRFHRYEPLSPRLSASASLIARSPSRVDQMPSQRRRYRESGLRNRASAISSGESQGAGLSHLWNDHRGDVRANSRQSHCQVSRLPAFVAMTTTPFGTLLALSKRFWANSGFWRCVNSFKISTSGRAP